MSILKPSTLLLLLALHSYAAISSSTAWEVRTVGASTNGGGFVQGATGTDMSIFDNKNLGGCVSCQSATVNISTTDAVAVGTTTITSATANFSAAIVGNIAYFTGGTGAIAAVRRQVVTFTNVTTIVLDASIAASTGMTMNIGGAMDTPATALIPFTSGNIIFLKKGTYTTNATIVLVANHTPAFNSPPNQLIGYNASRTDNPTGANRPTIQLITNAGLVALQGNGIEGWYIRNLIIDCNNLGTSTGIRAYLGWVIINCKIMNFTTGAIDATAAIRATILDTEVTGGTVAATNAITSNATNGTLLARLWVHDNVCVGVSLSGSETLLWSVISNNTGAASDGIVLSGDGAVTIMNNVVYGSGRDGINWSGANGIGNANSIRNNILTNNGRYGFNGSGTVGWAAFPMYDGNAYLGNVTAARHFMDDTGTQNPINAAAPYTNSLDVTLSVDPFTNAAGNNFTLNNTAGGGAALRGTGTPGAIPGVAQTGAMAFGVFQVTAGGGSNTAYVQ